MTKSFAIKNYLRQWDGLSPTLFNIDLDKAEREVKVTNETLTDVFGLKTAQTLFSVGGTGLPSSV